jgi:hypothetical protein
MSYEYNKELFNKNQIFYIEALIKEEIDQELFDRLTMLDKENIPIFNEKQL